MKSWKIIAAGISAAGVILSAGYVYAAGTGTETAEERTVGSGADGNETQDPEEKKSSSGRGGHGPLYRWAENLAEREIRRRTNISDTEYEQYEQLRDSGQLDADGSYIGASEQRQQDSETREKEAQRGQVRVTFGTNSFITVQYYLDAGRTSPVDAGNCYLDPGETIYASDPVIQNPNSSQYVFSGYRIYEYSEDGTQRTLLTTTDGTDNRVYTIPEDYSGTDLSIEPVGEYQARTLNFRAYYVDANGNEQNYAGGSWSVNGDVIEGKDTADIDPSDSYEVTYSFPTESYYCESAEPETREINNETGRVVFSRYKSIDAKTRFSVQLRPYSRIHLEGNSKKVVSLTVLHAEGGKDTIDSDGLSGGDGIPVRKGDTVSIVTKDGYQAYCDSYEVQESAGENEDEHVYTLSIPDSRYPSIPVRIGKTELKVVLDKSVGKSAEFSVSGSGFRESGLRWENSGFLKLDSDDTAVDEMIGLEKSVTVSVDAGDPGENSAYRIEADRKDEDGKGSQKIYYIGPDSESAEIEIYGDNDLTAIPKLYTDITLTVSKVDVIRYEQMQEENATVEVRLTDDTDQPLLTDGEILDSSRSVQVKVRPDEGFYIAGDGTKDGSYSYETTAGKYLSERRALLKKHPAEQLIDVTVDDTWDYGTCILKIDGKETDSGKYELRPDQKITMECTLKDPDLTIERKTDLPGFLGGLQKMVEEELEKDKETVTIPVTEDLDGQTVRPSDFISVSER